MSPTLLALLLASLAPGAAADERDDAIFGAPAAAPPGEEEDGTPGGAGETPPGEEGAPPGEDGTPSGEEGTPPGEEEDGTPPGEEPAAPSSPPGEAPPSDTAAAREVDIFGPSTAPPADTAAGREADIFGSSAAPPSDTAAGREADIFGSSAGPVPERASPGGLPGGPLTSDADIAARLDQAEKRVTLGGRLYLRGDLRLPDADDVGGEGSDPDHGADDLAWGSSNLLDLFVDARPNDRLRAYARGRLRYDPTVIAGEVDALSGEEQQQVGVLLDQLWLNTDAGRRVFVTVGKQRVKWGAGRFWNPTDFLQPQRLDALAFFDERTGVGMLRVHVPVDRVNLYAVADWEGADAVDELGGAARAELLVGLTEVALSAAARKDRPLRLGAQLTTGVWLLDLRLEAALQHGLEDRLVVQGATWQGFLDDAMAGNVDFDDPFASVTESRADDWIPQVVGGLELGLRLNDEDTLYLGGEGFYNDLGYTDPEVYPLLLFTGQYQPFYLGRAYAGAYALLPGPGRGNPWNDMSWTLSTIANLSDQTGVVRFDYSVVVHNELTLNAYVAGYLGEQGEFRYALEIPAVPGFLDQDIDLDAPVLDAGLGLTLGF